MRHADALLNQAKPKLPSLDPHPNRKAQDILSKHHKLRKAVEVSPSLAAVPVLVQVESTAPRTAPAHDVSHLMDKEKRLAPSIPPSRIPEEDHTYSPSFMPVDKSSVYNEMDGLWHTCTFPSEIPSSRGDAIQLDAWVTRRLEEYGKSKDGGADLSDAISDLVPILSVAMHEIHRQVMHHCPERGSALQKLWLTYETLFANVLAQMKTSLEVQKKSKEKVQQDLEDVKRELQELNREHPRNMQRIISELEAKYRSRNVEVDQEMEFYERDNENLKQQYRNRVRELDLWFPGFGMYQDSYIKSLVPQPMNVARQRASLGPATMGPTLSMISQISLKGDEEHRGPEVAIAEDFKRLLAILSPEKRRLIGSELVSSFGTSYAQQGTAEADRAGAQIDARRNQQSQHEELKAEIAAQEKQMQQMLEEIAELERLRDEEDSPMRARTSSKRQLWYAAS
mmetsp:Transcript_55239/g.131680  ORF Transcript_55239/g.131680 Transcript_55239/m.131680 type:complete len:453 (-) Transcript_55239:256-1614(-)|eukprot:CAMPEP_0178389152 /NCGR_PEP_ID=MMETSP0689_2-20121128/9963_1 /TAXON_ID=160604 /ORGANISM="Amphidinium massartii, Strain CS-259" /LENGTH=452 /DNA_ID=CAMNT_0020009581 /DNA_START=76 /DNA_END=1434 /DNA_ORIENTATION=-